jgi:hypothetical protein
MAYLIDANCLIQAKNLWYGFDFCPGFWDWIDNQNATGAIFSIDRIKGELLAGNDALKTWAIPKGDSFFLPTDTNTVTSYNQIVSWANSVEFTTAAISDFMGVADGWLVAHALAHGYTVVSHEKLDINQKSRIKIPRTCNQFGVPCEDLFKVLRDNGARFIL